jgi:hypothetical protein
LERLSVSNFLGKLLTPNIYGGYWFNLSPAAYLMRHIMSKDRQVPESRYNGIQVQKSIYGDPIPLVYGQQRLAISLGWYSDFQSIPHTDDSSGGGKGGAGSGAQQTTLTYSSAFIGLLCEGQISGIGNVWSDKTITSLSSLNLTLFSGAGGQAVWSYLTTNHTSEAIGYDHTAYVASGNFDLKDSAALPNLSFEIKGLLQYGGGIIDCDPSAVLTDYCTNADHGCNFTSLGSLTNYQNYCIAMGFFLSPLETAQRPAVDFIRELLDTTNSDCWVSAGVLNIIPLADASVTGNSHTYTPSLTPLYSFTDDDYQHEDGEDPVKLQRKPQSDVFNVFRVEYLDRANNYNTAIAEASDAQDIALNGLRIAPTKSLHMITTRQVARQVAQIMLQRNLYYRNTYQFKLRADYCLLEPMDIVSITDSGLGVTNQLVRIMEVQDDEEDNITLTAIELPLGPGAAPIYDWQLAQGYAANFGVAPGNVQTPQIMMAPPLLLGADGGYEIWIAVTGSSASSTWGGCRVLMSLDNVRYKAVGTVFGAARYGTLTSTLAIGGDPDSSHTLAIQLNNTALTLQAASTNDADFMRTIILVENEVMSYRDAALTGAGAYNLGYLRRGKYGTAIASHASGTRFVRLDGAIFRMPIDAGMIGQTLYFKFQSFNIYQGGLQDAAGLTAYSFVPNNPYAASPFEAGVTLVPRGDCVVVGQSIYKKSGGSSAFDSDCYSLESFANGCFVQFQCAQTNLAFAIGLNVDPTTDQALNSIDYCFNINASGTWVIYESGTNTLATASYTTSTIFRIEYDGNRLTYYVDGAYARSVEIRNKSFFFDSSFYDPGATAKNVTFGPLTLAPSIPFISRGNCVASATTIKKVGGSVAWDSDCYSYEAYANGCTLSFQAEQTNLSFMIGLNTDPTTDQNYTSLDYAWEADGSSAAAIIYESGSSVATIGTYTTSTQFSIVYDGRFVRYLKDGLVVRQVHCNDATFFMDSSFFSPGASARNVYFNASGAATPAPFITRGNCTVSDANAIKGGLTTAWDSDVYSVNAYTNCHVTFKNNDTSHDLMIGLGTNPTLDSSYTSIDYAFECTSGTIEIWENGTHITNPGTYTEATILAITYDGATINYLVDGVSVRTVAVAGLLLFMDSSFNTPGAGVNSLRFGPTTNLSVADTPQIGPGAVTPSPVSQSPADGSITFPAVSHPAVESVGVDGHISTTPVVATGTVKLDCAWSAQVTIDVTTSGVAVGESFVEAALYVNSVLAFVKNLSLEYTAGSAPTQYAHFAGATNISINAGDTVDFYLRSYRSFSSGGLSPAQVHTWRDCHLSVQAAVR